jgi:hypothetical protein
MRGHGRAWMGLDCDVEIGIDMHLERKQLFRDVRVKQGYIGYTIYKLYRFLHGYQM